MLMNMRCSIYGALDLGADDVEFNGHVSDDEHDGNDGAGLAMAMLTQW